MTGNPVSSKREPPATQDGRRRFLVRARRPQAVGVENERDLGRMPAYTISLWMHKVLEYAHMEPKGMEDAVIESTVSRTR